MIYTELNIRDQEAIKAQAAGFKYNISDMEGEIGGSYLDDLRDLIDANFSPSYNEDILFKLIEAPFDTLNYNVLPHGKTYLAKCLARIDMPEYIFVPDENDEEYLMWIEQKAK